MTTPRNATGAVLGRQVAHELVSLMRTPLTMILCIGFPLLFFVLLAALIGNETVDPETGVRLVQFLAPGLASFGVVMATFSFLATGLAEARASGVLKRQKGTPLPRWSLIGGRVGAAILLGFLAVALVLGVGVAFYDLQLFARSIVTVVVTLLVSSAALSACGLAIALLLPTPQMTVAVTNGVVIPLAFLSNMFTFGGDMPDWLKTLGWFFPLKHMVELFGDALDPYLTGSAFQWVHIAVIVAWGVAGTVVALWALRTGRDEAARSATATRSSSSAADARPRRTTSPSFLTHLWGQVAHTQAVLWRDASSVFFAVVFPLALVALIPTVNGGGDLELADGQLLGTFFAATMAIYGTAVTCYVNMPQGLAEDRERGVLKRTRATPLPTWSMLGGRIAGAVVVGLITLLAIGVLAAVMYSMAIPPTWAAALFSFLVSAVVFALLGLAVASLVHSAQAVLGVALGTLLPLCFISDVFVAGVVFPPVLDAIAWFFPLRHATRAMTQTMSGIGGIPWGHVAVLVAWGLVAAVVVATRFRWEVVKDTRARRG